MKFLTQIRASALVLAASVSLSALAGDITGAGATFPYAAYTKWAEAYKAANGSAVNYQGIGSGGGIKQIKAKTVDFAGTDAPLVVADLEADKLVQFPAVIGGATIVVNLPGMNSGDLKLDGDTAADIFRGTITKWNDPRITRLNPGKTLPATAITVCHRSDGSGTTFVFSNYMAKQSGAFKQTVGAGTVVNWPANGVGGKGNPGVAANVQKIAGAIGYVDYADALKNKLVFVALKNKAGNFVLPTQAAMADAAANSDFKVKGMAPDMLDQPGKNTWPIVSATYILAFEHADAAKQKSVVDFFTWSLNNGKKMAEDLGFVALPPAVVKLVEAEMKRIK
ncbi:MAG: phosphate ABC transporter substrate-binding protein PstS [Rhodocyclaceae bacterium]|nr:phosphate ABC transporter substrate-binding protein PstS [Rhodocyclaceae bacterium]